MRFLIDTCAGGRLAEWLREQGHDAVRVIDAGPDPGDAAILRRAVSERRILVTMDKDFGALVRRDDFGQAGPIRLPHCTAADRIAIFRTILAAPARRTRRCVGHHPRHARAHQPIT